MRRTLRLLVSVVVVGISGLVRAGTAQEPPVPEHELHAFLFGDIVYQVRESPQTGGFLMGQAVGHANARLAEHLFFFGEVSASARPDGYAFEVERAIVRYEFLDEFKVSAGRYHTPVSYWNTAYHHGLWLQTSVARPEMIKVGSTFLPVHFVGAVVEGVLSAQGVAFSYEAGVGNGRAATISRAGDAGDVNSSRALVFAGRLRPGSGALQAGGSLYFDRINVPPATVDERIASAHLAWDRGIAEVIVEYANVRHEDGAAVSTDSDGYYAHLGIRLPGALAGLKPYVRWERLDVDGADIVFAVTQPDYRAVLGGIRFDFESLAAVKAEFRRERLGGLEYTNALYIQLAFAVPVS